MGNKKEHYNLYYILTEKVKMVELSADFYERLLDIVQKSKQRGGEDGKTETD